MKFEEKVKPLIFYEEMLEEEEINEEPDTEDVLEELENKITTGEVSIPQSTNDHRR